MYKHESNRLNTPLKSSPLCNRHAQEAECDTYHVLLDCPALIVERKLLFLALESMGVPQSPEGILKSSSPKMIFSVFQFFLKTQLLLQLRVSIYLFIFYSFNTCCYFGISLKHCFFLLVTISYHIINIYMFIIFFSICFVLILTFYFCNQINMTSQLSSYNVDWPKFFFFIIIFFC